jgi:hypothetical protein
MTNTSPTAGIVAGPLFLVLWALQAFTRDGFDRAIRDALARLEER